MAKGLQERERLKLGFARYVSQYILEKILKSGSSAKFEGERKKITVIFTDIRHFTAIAEKLPPEDVVKILNQYFEEMIEVIFRNHGTLDKFLGDGIMIEFGAPLDDELQEKHAVITAIEMQQALKKLNAKWAEEGKEALKIGVGIHTGLAVVGNIGSERRMEYTAIGDTVNVASRLEQATKFADVSILISKATFTPIEGIFKATPMGALEVPGRHEPIDAFSIDPDQEIK
jgi:adenylate cyclase